MKTHYEVLNLDKTCSAKEIKDSFIKLSKKYHPDKNKSSDAHKKFVEVNEAYNVLGKEASRSRYDRSLSYESSREVFRPGPSYSTNMRTPYEQYSYYYARNRMQSHETPYFTKNKIGLFLFCCLLMMIGSGIQLKVDAMRRNTRTQELIRFLKENREQNEKLTDEEKIEKLKARFHEARLKRENLQK